MSAAEARAFVKKASVLDVFDDSGHVYKNAFCLCASAPAVKADPDLLFAKCQVLQGMKGKMVQLKQVDPPDDNIFDARDIDCFNDNLGVDPMRYSDIGQLTHTNAMATLAYMKTRFEKGQIFCTADPLLITLNPFKDVKNATPEYIAKYFSGDLAKLPAHNFSIAKEACDGLHLAGKSQTIIVSGESGAGKTESTKQIMRYLAYSKTGRSDHTIQNAIMSANPVLEAFGNAKTIRNDNSSRFGRFMTLELRKDGGMSYGQVQGFLLEKSRIVSQTDDECSYHVFYNAVIGCSSEEKKSYKLLGPKEYKSLNMRARDPKLFDDKADWNEIKESLVTMKMTQSDITSLMRVVSGCLLLGNVETTGADSGRLAEGGEDILKTVSDLFACSYETLISALTVKITKAAGEEIKGTYREDELSVNIKSLAKAMYSQSFQWVMRKLNEQIKNPNPGEKFMGMLDIFGFEVFKNNSLEQLFINITNEYLQKNFVDVVFKKENELYKSEGVSLKDMKYTSNDQISGSYWKRWTYAGFRRSMSRIWQ